MKEKKHIPVLLEQAIKSLNIIKNGIYIDGTFGHGGHSKSILNHINNYGRLYAIDKDPEIITYAKNISSKNFYFIHGSFSKLLEYTNHYNITGKVNGILLDLGTSYSQINQSNRGFSFMLNGPLDMRMNPKQGISAAQWLNNSTEKSITKVLKNFGQEKFSKKIAKAIVKYKPLYNTIDLVNIVKKIVPYKKNSKNPATKTFQAIRIYINNELEELKTLLNNVFQILKPGGRLSVISFHSLEDRIIKKFIIENSTHTFFPKNIPITEKELNTLFKKKFVKINKIFPSTIEIKNNPRSRSAILRTIERKFIT